MSRLTERTTHLPILAATHDTLLHTYPYSLLYATGTGSYAFGYASLTSDLDVHGAHLLPLDWVLGLGSRTGETLERKEPATSQHPALEIATHDLKKVIQLALKGNGNILEDLYSPLVIVTSPEHQQLQDLARGCLTRRCAAHYKGMAFNQQRNLTEQPVKRLLHAYRCLLMGIHLMRAGALELHLPTLAEEAGCRQVQELIALKAASPTPTLSEQAVAKHQAAIAALTSDLDQAAQRSALPEQPERSTRQALEVFLLRVRLEKGGLR